jgi:KipI family sensor histidine kinase inhibitor
VIDVRLLPYGDTAVLVEVADLDSALALHADLRTWPPVGVVDVVPAERTVLGWTVDRLLAAHQERTWRVAFTGFAPGFGYLVPDGDWPEVPRRADPRTSVPAGAVALAGRYAGVYPQACPGGWQLVGRTGLAVWDVDREPPALLVAGTRVRFEAVS